MSLKNTLQNACAAGLILASLHSPMAFSQEDGIRARLEQSGATTSAEKRDFATQAQDEMGDAVKKLAKSMADAEREREFERPRWEQQPQL